MITHVIVPLDGSENAEQALPYALAIAQHQQATIVLVAVVDIPADFGSWSGGPVHLAGSEIERWLEESKRYLEDVASSVNGLETTTIVKVGSPAREIQEVIHNHAQSLIVMSSHGRTGTRRMFLGSVATKLVHDAHCPIIVIRMRQQERPARTPSFENVLVPLDGSDFSEQALDRALDVLSSDIKLHLLRVVEMPTIPLGGSDAGVPLDYGLVAEYIDATKVMAEIYLTGLKGRIAGQHDSITTEVREGRVAETILDVAQERQVDLIAMASHGRGGLGRLVFGSVAERVLHEAEQPLLLIRPEA